MSYQVIARKWRPQKFDDVVGQQPVTRTLHNVKGPTADPCGECDACREIAEGRDMDVMEIDAATHTQVDNIREVIISGLSIAPVRNRFKIFIIDEVHQLSSSSFNALLKSI